MAGDLIRDMSADAAFATCLERALLADLAARLSQADNSRVAFAVHASDGACVAGITGSTSYGWLKIGLLWVHQTHRRRGLGRRLVKAAFASALEFRCHACWLETSNPDAHEFYIGLGFQEFGQLQNGGGQVIPDHRRWFLQRAIVNQTDRQPG